MKIPSQDVKIHSENDMLTLKALSFHFITLALLDKEKDAIWSNFLRRVEP